MRRAFSAAAVVLTAAGAAGGQDGPAVETFQIGTSGGGRAITVWRIGDPGPDALGRGPDQRPALLIVAGLDGRHDFGTRLGLTLIDRLVSGQGELLGAHTVYIVPDLNPDNDALFDRPGTPRADFGRAPRPSDADGDGRVAEDPADDLNGDGLITMMRVLDPAPGAGLTATLVTDPDDPRVLRKPDAAAGEIARYSLLIEGVDNDGDGRFNEDGIAGSAGGGIALDRNFPSLWPEHADGAGSYALSEPETRKLVEWMLTRDNIVCALAYSPHDNVLNIPEAGKTAPDGREPTGIEEGDKAAYEKVRDAYKDITRQTGAPKGEWPGSFTQWAYGHFGVYSFATPAWVRPDLVQAGEDAEGEKADKNGNDVGTPSAQPDPESERRALQERGVPQFVIDFILASPEERAEVMAGFDDLSEQEQASRMAAVAALPEDIQLRVRALISGQPDPARADEDGPPARRGNGKPAEGDEAKWIAYSDDHLGGAGFVEWTPFDHPQLGEVEIGGLVPGIRHEPPEGEWGRLADEQTRFVASLLGMLPRLETRVEGVERLGPGLWRIAVRAENPGGLPTTSAIGEKAGRIPPIVVRLGLEAPQIVSGERVQRWGSIPGHGGRARAEWIVAAPDGARVPVEIRSGVFGDRLLNIELEEID